MPGAKEIVESQGSASNTSRSVPVASIARCWSTTIGSGPTAVRIAVVVADDQRRAGRQVEARNVPVGLNQIAGIRAGQRGEMKVRSSRVGPAQVRVGEVRTGVDVVTVIHRRSIGPEKFAFVRLAWLRFAPVRLAPG